MATIGGISRIQINVKKFRPIGSVTTTTVEMDLQNADPATVPGAISDGLITLVGSYYIRVPIWSGTPTPIAPTQAMQVKFWVTDAATDPQDRGDYLLQGIAFSNRDLSPSNHLGQLDFSQITIGLEPVDPVNPGGRKERILTVTNLRTRPNAQRASYDYLFLIQRIKDGAIGIIDPEWENE